MESMLIAVTLLSLAIAAAMGSVTWRLLRQERRRSAARVAALAALAERQSSPLDVAQAALEANVPAALDERVRPAPDLPLRRTLGTMTNHRAAEGLAGGGGIFGAGLQSRGRTARPIIFSSVGVAMALAVVVAWYAGAREGDVRPAAPLELVSLGHDRQEDALRITGLVQNPQAGKEMRNIFAVAFLFDRDGTLIASGRAPLDFVRLAPGEESPFTIVVAGAGDVARYRLGFRTRDGRVLTHVDRRFDTSTVRRPAAAAHESALAAGARSPVPEGRE